MRKMKTCFTMVLVCALLMSMSPFAAARASEQIANYDIDVATVSGGKIAIKFSVTGTNFMNRLGAESIYIYERGTVGWTVAEKFDADDTNMTRSNVAKYGNTIYFYGESGTEYRIIVTIFAEDKNGDSDSRSRTFTVTAQ